ncbi:envelope stress response membrane protein PspB [Sphingomonas sp. ASV193]|uniref:envelope stress response membrane protein PspB n=1 Tax=Sphingomonas sp. ASV193 TaxID=3144405 RepID=UPI0032E8BA41
MMGYAMGALAIITLFLGLPWLVFHYVTKWKTAAKLTGGDEKLLDELYDAARRLDDRLCSIERIMTAENPDWRASCPPPSVTGRVGLLDHLDEARDLNRDFQELTRRSRERSR